MSSSNPDRDGRPGNRKPAATDAVPEDDPLMPALTGAPAPAEDGSPGHRARYEAAVDDIERLRTHLRLIGDAVATAGSAKPSGGETAGSRRVRSRPRMILALAAVLAAVVAGAAALAREAAQGDVSTAKLTDAGIAACSRAIVEGTIERTVRDDGEARIVLAADRYLKPHDGPDRFSFTVRAAEASYFRPGTTMIVVVSRFREEGVITFEGRDLDSGRARMAAAVAESRSLPCQGPG